MGFKVCRVVEMFSQRLQLVLKSGDPIFFSLPFMFLLVIILKSGIYLDVT